MYFLIAWIRWEGRLLPLRVMKADSLDEVSEEREVLCDGTDLALEITERWLAIPICSCPKCKLLNAHYPDDVETWFPHRCLNIRELAQERASLRQTMQIGASARPDSAATIPCDWPASLTAAVQQVEQELAGVSDREVAYVLSPKGAVLLHREELRARVNFGRMEYSRMAGSMVIQRHRHASSFTLCVSDLWLACHGALMELRSVNGSWVHRLTPSHQSCFHPYQIEQLVTHYSRAYLDVFAETHIPELDGEASPLRSEEQFHLTWRRTADLSGLDYSRVFWEPHTEQSTPLTSCEPWWGVVSWLELGSELAQDQLLGESLQSLDRAIRERPDDLKAWQVKADVLRKLGREDELARCYERIRTLTPRSQRLAHYRHPGD